MKCPHCYAELRYRERSNRTCSKCRQQFVLEPKANTFKLHDLGLRELLNRLSQNGTIRLTSEQVLGALLRRQQAKTNGFPCGLYILATIVTAFFVWNHKCHVRSSSFFYHHTGYVRMDYHRVSRYSYQLFSTITFVEQF